jgi:hypothetical protein
VGSSRPASRPYHPTKSASPATHPALLNSPRNPNPYSPQSASPRSTILPLPRDATFEYQPSPFGMDPRSNSDAGPGLSPSSNAPPPPIPSTSPSPMIPPSHYQAPRIHLPPRRTFGEPARVPPLTREDTTLSSEGSSGPHSGHSLPSMRFLPQPVPGKGFSASPLDQSYFPNPSQPPRLDYQASSLEALVRAGELARAADHKASEMNQHSGT